MRQPLQHAAEYRHAKVVELLVSTGAEPDTSERDNPLQMPAHRANKPVHSDSVESSVENGANIETTTLQLDIELSRAVSRGRNALAELLISRGANVNSENAYANRPLHNAAISGDPGIMRLLLANDANVNAPGETALHAAAFGGHLQAAEVLLANGADVNATDLHGYTPIRRAVERGDEVMVNLLIRVGADITIRDAGGKTLLHVVAPARHVAVAEQLIAGGVDITRRSSDTGARATHAREHYERAYQIPFVMRQSMESSAIWINKPSPSKRVRGCAATRI